MPVGCTLTAKEFVLIVAKQRSAGLKEWVTVEVL